MLEDLMSGITDYPLDIILYYYNIILSSSYSDNILISINNLLETVTLRANTITKDSS